MFNPVCVKVTGVNVFIYSEVALSVPLVLTMIYVLELTNLTWDRVLFQTFVFVYYIIYD